MPPGTRLLASITHLWVFGHDLRKRIRAAESELWSWSKRAFRQQISSEPAVAKLVLRRIKAGRICRSSLCVILHASVQAERGDVDRVDTRTTLEIFLNWARR